MASTVISTPTTNVSRSQSSRKKKKLKSQRSRDQSQSQNQDDTITKWKSDSQQQIYSSKLLQALCHANSKRRGKQAVRETADQVLAATAKGKTRWSRAILTKRLKIKFAKKARSNKRRLGVAENARSRKSKVSVLRLKMKGMPAVQRKVKALGRLVPGCRKQPLPVVLEEATDYIAALEMQVRAMTRLTEMLSSSSFGSGATSSSSM